MIRLAFSNGDHLTCPVDFLNQMDYFKHLFVDMNVCLDNLDELPVPEQPFLTAEVFHRLLGYFLARSNISVRFIEHRRPGPLHPRLTDFDLRWFLNLSVEQFRACMRAAGFLCYDAFMMDCRRWVVYFCELDEGIIQLLIQWIEWYPSYDTHSEKELLMDRDTYFFQCIEPPVLKRLLYAARRFDYPFLKNRIMVFLPNNVCNENTPKKFNVRVHDQQRQLYFTRMSQLFGATPRALEDNFQVGRVSGDVITGSSYVKTSNGTWVLQGIPDTDPFMPNIDVQGCKLYKQSTPHLYRTIDQN